MPDFARITDKVLDFLCQNDNGILDEESDDDMLWVGISRGEGNFLTVAVEGESTDGGNKTAAKYRVTVERVTDDA